MNIKEKFHKAIENFSDSGNYLAYEACKLGYPEETKSIPTAAVMWDENAKKVKFCFNKQFHEKLTQEEFDFVLAHEAIHLLNMHIFILKEQIDDLKRLQTSNQDIYKFSRKFNKAADCVVNDSLVNLYGFKKVETVPTEPIESPVLYGKNLANTDCHDLGVMEVFYLLPEDQNQQGQDESFDVHSWDSFFNQDGTLKEEFKDAVFEFIEKNIENSNIPDDQLSKIYEMKKDMAKYAAGKRAGTQQLGALRPIDGLMKIQLNWSKFFFELVERKKQKNAWNRPNKKTISIYPDVVLPSLVNEEKEDIFIAIDTSGSIDYEALKVFISVVKNVPKSFNVRAISFDTMCYEYDIKGKDGPKGGGGTRFDIIETYIKTNLKKYPKAVFVLTDGYGTPVDPQHPNRWCWVLYGASCEEFCKNMKKFNIKDLLK